MACTFPIGFFARDLDDTWKILELAFLERGSRPGSRQLSGAGVSLLVGHIVWERKARRMGDLRTAYHHVYMRECEVRMQLMILGGAFGPSIFGRFALAFSQAG